MSLYERYGTRDLTYSRWHRPDRISRYVTADVARSLTYIDLDAIEVCDECYAPLALIELARDIGQAHKSTRIVVELARRARVPATLVFYAAEAGTGDITRFRVRTVWPHRGVDALLTPAQYAAWLHRLRRDHRCARYRHGPERRPSRGRP